MCRRCAGHRRPSVVHATRQRPASGTSRLDQRMGTPARRGPRGKARSRRAKIRRPKARESEAAAFSATCVARATPWEWRRVLRPAPGNGWPPASASLCAGPRSRRAPCRRRSTPEESAPTRRGCSRRPRWRDSHRRGSPRARSLAPRDDRAPGCTRCGAHRRCEARGLRSGTAKFDTP